MENATDKIKLFNSILESFLLQTATIVGSTYHHYFVKLIKVNAPVPINYAITNLIVFKDQILSKNEDYFNNETNYINNLNNLNNLTDGIINTDNTLSEIMRLKDIYYKLDTDSKENVWSILQALLQLTIEYCELKNIKY
jgi:hypothetical protein